jgi:hypothetical protein
MKILVVLLLMVVVASLFSGLFFLLRDGKGGRRTVRALTLRIALSLLLFALLMIGFQTGLLGAR